MPRAAHNTAPATCDAATSDEPNPALAMVDVFVAAALAAYLHEHEQPSKAVNEIEQPHP